MAEWYTHTWELLCASAGLILVHAQACGACTYSYL